MKKTLQISLLVLSSILLFGGVSNAQCSGRFYDPNVFPGFWDSFLPTLPTAVQFGSAPDYQGVTKNLSMYIFQPPNDTMAHRPLVILAFGGSFLQGLKESPDVLHLCNAFQKRGFVTASIDYRLGANPIDSLHMMMAVLRGMQDMKAAIRFIYKDALTTNTYKIDTNNIFIGGVSAGAFIGIHCAYLNDTTILAPWMQEALDTIGGLEGNSGNPNFSTKIKGVVNLSGAIGDTSWIKAGDPTMVSMH